MKVGLFLLAEENYCSLKLSEITIGFDPVQYTVSEQSGSVEVSVSVLDGEISSGISVEVSLAERSGTAFGECMHARVKVWYL